MAEGILFYLMGPSGAGKDSLLAHAQRALGADDSRVLFARRWITRPEDYGGEGHHAISPEGFAAMAETGLFCMEWQAHGFRYGIGREVVEWLAAGSNVVVSGSREHFPDAMDSFPDLIGIYVRSSLAVLAQRLAARGREATAEIRSRLERSPVPLLQSPQLVVLDNDGDLHEAGERLVQILRGHKIPPCRLMPR